MNRPLTAYKSPQAPGAGVDPRPDPPSPALRYSRDALGHSCSHPQRRLRPSAGEACGKAEHILLSENRFYLKKKQMGRELAPSLMEGAGSKREPAWPSPFPPVSEDTLGNPHRPWGT